MEFAGPAPQAPQRHIRRVRVCTRDRHQAYVCCDAEIHVWAADEGRVRGTLRLSGGPEPSERRRCYRVPLMASGTWAQVAEQTRCQVLDASSGGMGVLTPMPIEPGQVVPVHVESHGKEISGHMRVCYRRPQPDGRFRCGLAVLPGDIKTARRLQAMAMDGQRRLLQRIARRSRGAQDAGI